MRLSKPSGTFEATMALFSKAIEIAKAWASEGKGPEGSSSTIQAEAVGSGPFASELGHDDTSSSRQHGYWDGRRSFAKVVFKTITDKRSASSPWSPDRRT